jgi:hypothetical protein
MPVPAERRSWCKVDAHLDGLASRGAEIVPLEIGALDPLLRGGHRQRQAAHDQGCDHHSHRVHVASRSFECRRGAVQPASR